MGGGCRWSFHFDEWHPMNLHSPQGCWQDPKDALLPLRQSTPLVGRISNHVWNLKMYEKVSYKYLACHAAQSPRNDVWLNIRGSWCWPSKLAREKHAGFQNPPGDFIFVKIWGFGGVFVSSKENFSSNFLKPTRDKKKATNGFRRGNLQTLFVESLTAHGRNLANKLT